MEIFNIELAIKVQQGGNLFYVEFIPQNEYYDIVKKCDKVSKVTLEDSLYLESVKSELYNILTDIYKTEFTNNYSL